LQPILIGLGIYSFASLGISTYLTSHLFSIFGVGSIFKIPLLAGISSAATTYF